MYEKIKAEAHKALKELLEVSSLTPGSIVVIGCSSSEIVGETIGHGSSIDAAAAVFEGVFPLLKENGLYLAAQCCEHLNRAIVIEREALPCCAEPVCAVPKPKAGGSFASLCYERFKEPILLEEIKADAGMDIGGTLIGMHLKKVAVPVRLSLSKIGEATLICARTRPKYIGGPRALYE